MIIVNLSSLYLATEACFLLAEIRPLFIHLFDNEYYGMSTMFKELSKE